MYTLNKAKTSSLLIDDIVSAVMDDEARDLELQQLLRISDDTAVRERWTRYQLTRAILQRDLPTCTSISHLELADRVQSVLADDTVPAPASVLCWLSPWLQPITGIAVAASVAMVTILGAYNIGLMDTYSTLTVHQEGIVLVEPNSNKNLQLASSAFGTPPAPQATAQVLRLNQPLVQSTAPLHWQVKSIPAGFSLLQQQVDELDPSQRENLIYSNGQIMFNLIIEPLLGRQIAEGHTTVGADLVLGRSMQVGDQQLFVTVVGQLSLDDAELMVASLSSL
jgi:negative regulator of sigma E activity